MRIHLLCCVRHTISELNFGLTRFGGAQARGFVFVSNEMKSDASENGAHVRRFLSVGFCFSIRSVEYRANVIAYSISRNGVFSKPLLCFSVYHPFCAHCNALHTFHSPCAALNRAARARTQGHLHPASSLYRVYNAASRTHTHTRTHPPSGIPTRSVGRRQRRRSLCASSSSTSLKPRRDIYCRFMSSC